MERVDPDRLDVRLRDLSYPVTRSDAAAAFAETELGTGEGAVNLGRLISEVGSDAFGAPGELADELEETLPDCEG